MVEHVVSTESGPEWTPHMTRLMERLTQNQNEWVKIRELAKHAGFSTGGSCPEARAAIQAMNEYHKKPIVSSNKGFLWATNNNQVMRYARELHARAKAINARAKVNAEIARSLR